MRKALHILTKPDDSLAREIISLQEKSGAKVEVFDFNQGEPDYKILCERIFESDSIEVW